MGFSNCPKAIKGFGFDYLVVSRVLVASIHHVKVLMLNLRVRGWLKFGLSEKHTKFEKIVLMVLTFTR